MVRPLAPGQVVGGFRLEELLHRGGMALLWRVTHPAHDPLPMIMKVPIIGYGEGAGAIVGFEVEEMILRRLSGPHVPRFVAAQLAEQPYLVMERIPGPSLLPLVEKAPLPAAEVAALGAKVALALHDLHRQHVIHFDVKPSNVMMRESGEAVLIDFGLSRHDQLPDLLAEEARLPVGTAPYISPEQVLGHRRDPRSDLFALGAMLYLFATGQRPFGNPQHSRRALRRRLYQDPVPPRALDPSFPPWLQEIILRLLERDPEMRYATGAQAAFDLAHPKEVRLTERADRMNKPPLGTVIGRWFKSFIPPEQAPQPTLAGRLAAAPIVMAAVDLAPDMQELADALRVIVRRILEIEPKARLACVNVLKVPRIGIDFGEDEQGRSLHLQRLLELKHWARPLGLPEERVTCTVVESPDPAAALVDYARQVKADHIVIGARGTSALRRYLGSVSSQVVAEAPCNVTVVRTRVEVEELGRSLGETLAPAGEGMAGGPS